jgi:hypothetical protein
VNALPHHAALAPAAQWQTLGLSPELALLVKRITQLWSEAGLSGDLAECVRNALCVVQMLPASASRDSDDDAITGVFADALLHRRREPGFERVSEYTAPFLGQQAMFLWRKHEEDCLRVEETGRYQRLTCSTMPAPPAAEDACECCGLTGCDGECHDDDAPSAAELLEHDRREYARMVSRGGEW